MRTTSLAAGGERVCVAGSTRREVGPRQLVNNRYFPQNKSGVVLDEKGLSWHFLSWCKSCVYAHVKGRRLVLEGFFVCVFLFFFLWWLVGFCGGFFVCFLILHLERVLPVLKIFTEFSRICLQPFPFKAVL